MVTDIYEFIRGLQDADPGSRISVTHTDEGYQIGCLSGFFDNLSIEVNPVEYVTCHTMLVKSGYYFSWVTQDPICEVYSKR